MDAYGLPVEFEITGEQVWDDVFLDLDPERGLKAGERWQESAEARR